MSDDDNDAESAAASGQRADRVGTQPVTNTSPSGNLSTAGIGRPEIGIEDLNPTQMEAWLTLIEIVFGAEEDEA
jgi:hypothetical protein